MDPDDRIAEELFGGPGRVAVLRVLSRATAPLTGRQVAAQAALSQAGAMRALDRLAGLGVVSRQPVGRAILHELRRESPIVTSMVLPVFEGEAALPPGSTRKAAEDTGDPRVNPRIRPMVPGLVKACRRHHVSRAALFGSATQTEPGVEPRDVDLLVTFESLPPGMKAEEFSALVEELETIMGMPVDILVSTAIRNPYLREELDRTQVVVYEAA